MTNKVIDGALTKALDAVAKRYGFVTWREFAKEDLTTRTGYATEVHAIVSAAFAALRPLLEDNHKNCVSRNAYESVVSDLDYERGCRS